MVGTGYMRFLVETHKEERRERVEEGKDLFLFRSQRIYNQIIEISVSKGICTPPSEILVTKVRILHNVSTDRHIFNVMSTLWNMSQRLKKLRFCHLRQCG